MRLSLERRLLLRTLPPTSAILLLQAPNGSYSFSVVAGRYEIQIMSTGFKVFQQGPIQITDGTDLRLNAALSVDSASTVVEVSAETPSIDLSNTQVGETISAQKMTASP